MHQNHDLTSQPEIFTMNNPPLVAQPTSPTQSETTNVGQSLESGYPLPVPFTAIPPASSLPPTPTPVPTPMPAPTSFPLNDPPLPPPIPNPSVPSPVVSARTQIAPDSSKSVLYTAPKPFTPIKTPSVYAKNSFQVRALVRKTVSYQKRQIFVNVCCIGLCPLLMVVISSVLATFLTKLINDSIVVMDVLYCANADAMNSTWNIPLSSDFPTATNQDIRGLAPNTVTKLINFILPPLDTSRAGPPVLSRSSPCVYWDRRDYPYSLIYERDPFANLDNPQLVAVLNPNTPLGQNARRVSRMASTLTPDIKYGWLNIYSLVYPSILLQLTNTQTYPWFVISEPSGVNLGNRPKINTVSFESALEQPSANPSASGFLGFFPDMYYLTTNFTPGRGASPSGLQPVPFFDKYLASENLTPQALDKLFYTVLQDTIESLTGVDKTVLSALNPSQLDLLAYNFNISKIITKVPWGGILFNQFESSSATYDYILQVGKDARVSSAGSFPSEGFRRFWLNSMLSNAIAQSQTPSFTISHSLRAMPFVTNTAINIPAASLLGRILYPFGVSFLLPIFILILVKEKEERILIMMKMNGLSAAVYYLAHYLHFYTMHILASAIFMITGAILKLPLFTQTAPIVYIILFFVWGHLQIALAFFLSTFFSKARNALVTSLIVVLLNVISNIAFDSVFSPNAPWFYYLWPPFAFYRALLVILRASSDPRIPSYRLSTLDAPDNEVRISLIVQTLTYFVYFFFAYYFSQVLPTEFGVQRPWHFIVSDLYRKFTRKDEKEKMQDIKNLEAALKDDEVQYEDADVKSERARVDSNNILPNSPLIIRHMRKIYPGTQKVAVKDITLAVEPDMIFGLLGPNGAGKTSLISILTGLYPQTAGAALIGGFDIDSERNEVNHLVGICPQHDILWDDLTVGEHLLFYARLKGIPANQEMKAKMDSLKAVSLEKFEDRLSKGLSGGEKRRLSIAISLLGDPKTVFLDEPTTGLDPEVRRLIWNIVLAAKKGKTIILTTHSMEEAEVLCQRIGIMARGTLRCIGSQLRLKKLYGSGFKLIFLAPAEHMEVATQHILSLLPKEATITDSFATCKTIEFFPFPDSIPKIFEQIETFKHEWHILDWGISQTTLEEVFLKIISEDDAEGTSSD